ncbi:MAG: response regulator [bacterium]|nr:response regulator [bacterium]
MKSYWAIILFFFYPFFVPAQSGHHFFFESISGKQGLSQNSVHAIVQDKEGFLWFGTEDGLNKYDGYSFTIYRKQSGQTHSISNNNIKTMLESRLNQDTFWIGTDGGGLNRLDKPTMKFYHYCAGHGEFNIASNTVFTLAEDREGLLWIGTDAGLNRLNPTTGKLVLYQHAPLKADSISDNNIRSICLTREGDPWVGTDNGLSKYRRRSDDFLHYMPPPPAGRASASGDMINAIVEDSEGILWLGSYGGGVIRFDPKTERFTRYKHNASNPKSLGGDMILSLLDAPDGALWVGTMTSGISILDKKTGFFCRYKKNTNTLEGLNDNMVFTIFRERTGIIFLGTGVGGINKINAWKRKFKLLRNDPLDKQSLRNESIWAVYQDENGELWVGGNNGLERLDKEKRLRKHYDAGANNKELSHNNVRCIHEDKRGNFWIGTLGGGINLLNRRTDTFTYYTHDPTNPGSIPNDEICSIYEDKLGRMWFGFFDGGFSMLQHEKNTFINFSHDPDKPGSLSDNTVDGFIQDGEGNMWLGTRDGLNLWKARDHLQLNPVFTHYRHSPDQPGTIADNCITCFFENADGEFFIGTTGGLNQLDKKNGGFISYTVKDGLPNSVIYSILEDNQQYLWLSTNNGLSRFDYRRKEFKNYDVSSGLQSNEFNNECCFKNKKGEMFFGGVSGLNYFFPGDIRDNPNIPPIVITDFKKFNNSMPLDRAVTYADRIVLSYQENYISFEYAALDYGCSEKNQYSIKLEGLDTDWVEVGNARQAVYTNLNAGTYTFRVIGSNHDGVWNHEGTSIKLLIIPPFWKTHLFYLLLAVLFFLGGTGLYLRKTRNQRLYRKLLEDQVRIRTTELTAAKERAEISAKTRADFLANMSHEMRTPMHGILGMTELTLETDLNRQQRENLTAAKTSADKLLLLIDNILELTKSDSGDMKLKLETFNLHGIMEAVFNEFSAGAESKNLELTHYISPAIPNRLFGAPARLKQVLMNLLRNALKFTRQGTILMEACVYEAGKHAILPPEAPAIDGEKQACVKIQFYVSDTGIGIDKETQEKIFEPFMQGDTSSTRRFGGAGLGLTIAARLLNLMGGRIMVESPQSRIYASGEQGTTFSFAVPFEIVNSDTNGESLHETTSHKNETGKAKHTAASSSDTTVPARENKTPSPQQLPTSNLQKHIAPQSREPAKDNLTRKIESRLEQVPEKDINTPKTAKNRPPADWNILVAEDNKINLKLISMRLKQMGYTATLVENGEEVLFELEKMNFDIILMDIQMPRMDGLDTARVIRERESRQGKGKRLPIIALTANNSREDREKILSAGIDAHVAKPFKPADLVAALQRMIPQVEENRRSA